MKGHRKSFESSLDSFSETAQNRVTPELPSQVAIERASFNSKKTMRSIRKSLEDLSNTISSDDAGNLENTNPSKPQTVDFLFRPAAVPWTSIQMNTRCMSPQSQIEFSSASSQSHVDTMRENHQLRCWNKRMRQRNEESSKKLDLVNFQNQQYRNSEIELQREITRLSENVQCLKG